MGKKHTHKYHRIQMSYAKVWSCALPGCSHFMPKHQEAAVVGRLSICWKCEREFALDVNSMGEDKPQCFDCSHEIKKDNKNDLIKHLEALAEKD